MKKITISSILAITACFSMISQASAAPKETRHHVAQVKHQQAHVKADNKHQQVKKKVVVQQHRVKEKAPNIKAKSHYPDKYSHRAHS